MTKMAKTGETNMDVPNTKTVDNLKKGEGDATHTDNMKKATQTDNIKKSNKLGDKLEVPSSATEESGESVEIYGLTGQWWTLIKLQEYNIIWLK